MCISLNTTKWKHFIFISLDIINKRKHLMCISLDKTRKWMLYPQGVLSKIYCAIIRFGMGLIFVDFVGNPNVRI